MHDIRQGTCPLCGHNEIIEGKPYEDRQSSGIKLASGHEGLPWSSLARPWGVMRSFTCRSCGYTQLFVQEPSKVPIDEECCTRLITAPAAQGPFR